MSILFGITFIYIISYFVIFEAYYKPNSVLTETISITDTTSYFIDNEDVTYDLYYSGIFFETVSSLDYYRDDIPIYTREEYDKLIFK